MSGQNRNNPFREIWIGVTITVLGTLCVYYLGFEDRPIDRVIIERAPENQQQAISQKPDPSISISVLDILGQGQISDELELSIGGMTKHISLDLSNSSEIMDFKLPKADSYRYIVKGTTTVLYNYEYLAVYGAGEGNIYANDNDKFQLFIEYNYPYSKLSLVQMD